MKALEDRVALRLARGRLRVCDPADIYHLEADGSTTLVRIRSARRLRDVRPLGDLSALLSPHGFLRVHRSHAVNLRHVREVRPSPSGSEWELRLSPPLNVVLPVSREGAVWVRDAYGDRKGKRR
jgi:two-component system LytT family response regulator